MGRNLHVIDACFTEEIYTENGLWRLAVVESGVPRDILIIACRETRPEGH